METTIDAPASSAPATSETSATPSATPSSVAPASPPESASPPAAPARPTSFKAALAQVEAKQSETPAVPPAPAATVQAGVSPQTPSATPQGPIPFDVHHKALENARTKTVQERDAQWMEKYGWATTIEKDALDKWIPFAKRISTDPAGHLRDFLAPDVLQHPQHGPAIRAELGRIFQSLGNGNGEPQPDVQLVNEQGQVTGMTYSADAQAKKDAWLLSQWRNEWQREIGPIKAEREQQQQQAAQQQARAALESKADVVMSELLEIVDGKTDLLPAIDALMGEHPEWSAHKAALEVRKTKIVPTQQQTAQAAAADSFRKKAAANTSDGRASTSTPPKRPTTRQELADFLRAREAAG